jgi:hypothetical protein
MLRIQDQILNRICDSLAETLKEGITTLSQSSPDGRVNSAINEGEVRKALLHFSKNNEWFRRHSQLTIQEPPPRSWYDFVVIGPNVFVPVNIKVSACNTADNLNCKLGLYYALTGRMPDFGNGTGWQTFMKELAQHISNAPDADYYFLVVSKRELGEVFWTSLKKIGKLVPNGNNPPFQCNWSENRNRVSRSEQEARSYLLGILGETFRQRAQPLNHFQRHLQHFVREQE